MAVSKVSICNLALRQVGEKTIMSLDEDTKEANLCNELYDEVLEQVLETHPWNCALKRASLAETATDPAFGWSNSYQLPNDCLRVIRMEDPKMDFVVENGLLLCNNGTAKILYIKKIEDPTEIEPLVRKVFYLAMAVEMSYTLTGTNTALEVLGGRLEQAYRDARSKDAQTGTPMFTDQSNWIQARISGSPGYGRDLTTAY